MPRANTDVTPTFKGKYILIASTAEYIIQDKYEEQTFVISIKTDTFKLTLHGYHKCVSFLVIYIECVSSGYLKYFHKPVT